MNEKDINQNWIKCYTQYVMNHIGFGWPKSSDGIEKGYFLSESKIRAWEKGTRILLTMKAKNFKASDKEIFNKAMDYYREFLK